MPEKPHIQQPGIRLNLSIENFSADEKKIIDKLSKTWFISFAKVHEFKGSRYAYVFLKPTVAISERFNLYNEVLCLFSAYDKFDARSLDYVDKTLSDFDNRLDKLCVQIISKSEQIIRDISKLSADKESRIYIPFKYSEILNSVNDDVTILTRRLEEHLYTKDLFAFDSPLRTEKYFFGRKADVQTLIGKYSNGENGCIFGLRRIGKTSVLLAVERQLKSINCPVVYLDCSDTKFHRNSWNKALYFIKDALFKSNNISNLKTHKENEYTEQKASECFENDLNVAYSYFNKKRILLIFDEIESITFDLSASENWANNVDYIYFWQTIRSIYQQNNNLFSFVISGVNPKPLETARILNKHDNPIYRFITPNYLGFFKVDTVEYMINYIGQYMGIKFEKEVATYLTDYFGGHPFLIRQFCSQLHKHLDDKNKPRPLVISKNFYTTNIKQLSTNLIDYIDLIIQVLVDRYPEEYELLEHLANGEETTFHEFAKNSREWIQHLVGYGLIIEDENRFFFRINMVKDLIKSKTSKRKMPTSLEAKWEFISRDRNSFESELRKIVKLLLKTTLGAKNAREQIINSMSKANQKSKALMLSYDDIFEKELYFSDLKRTIESNWTIFEKIFKSDQQKFSIFMDLANKNRVDAHANEISEDEFNITISAIHWLNQCLKENT